MPLPLPPHYPQHRQTDIIYTYQIALETTSWQTFTSYDFTDTPFNNNNSIDTIPI